MPDTESVKLYDITIFISIVFFFFVFIFSLPVVDAQLDDVGFSFVKNSISAIEKRGEL